MTDSKRLRGLVESVLSSANAAMPEEEAERLAKTMMTAIGSEFFYGQIGNNVKAGHRNKQSYANKRTSGKEQYYTSQNVVDICLAEVQKHVDLSSVNLVEPCGGTGEFIDGLIRLGVSEDNITSFDIEPKHELVRQGDYLKQDLSGIPNLVSITNPPFGRASSLAKKFFNHDAKFCTHICYLIPKAWRKWSVHNSLDKNFHLVSDIDLPQNCFYLADGTKKEKDVLNTVFQIWERRDQQRPKIKIPDHKLIQKVIPETTKGNLKVVKGANFSIVAFGHSAGRCEDVTEPVVPYKTTTMYLKIKDEKVKEALRQVDLSKFYNNVSYVQALSIQEINYALNEFFGLSNFKF